MAELSQKKHEEAPVTEIKQKTDKTAQLKLLSLIFVFIMFVVSYFALKSGSETFMWVSLALTTVASLFLYARN